MCDVPSIAVFYSESIECFPDTASKFFLKFLVTIPVAPIITGIMVHFRFHIRCISIHKLLYLNFFYASLLLLLVYFYEYLIPHIHIFFEPNLKVLHRRYSADVDLQTELLTQNVRTRSYLRTKFNTPVPSVVLDTANKFKTKKRLRTADALLYCSLQKSHLNKSFIYCQSLLTRVILGTEVIFDKLTTKK